MTASMTAFARRETATPWGGLVWELRAVNHRYLELSLKLPPPPYARQGGEVIVAEPLPGLAAGEPPRAE